MLFGTQTLDAYESIVCYSPCIPRGVHTERGAYREGCIHRGVHTERGAYREGCIHRGVHTERGAYPEGCIPRGVHTERGAYREGCIQRGVHTQRPFNSYFNYHKSSYLCGNIIYVNYASSCEGT